MNESMKKYLSLLLALVLALGMLSVPAAAEEASSPDEELGDILLDEAPVEAEEEDAEKPEREYPDELRVGHPTITKGDFFTEMFGNDTADIDVRALIHGYNLVNWDQNQGVYLIDESVVENVKVATNEAGDKYYYLGLYDDLYYSDGTPITAWDYAFSLLLMMSPEIEEIGGKIYRAEHILGYDAYITGKTPYLEGVGVIDERQLVIILDHEFLPYFFETGLLLCVPYPISVIAPGCKVYSDGAEDQGDGYGMGIYIANEDPEIEEPIYTADLLRQTILDPDTGYNSHPSVSSGPYVLTDYDYVTAHFELNPYYKGAWVFNTLPDGFYYDIAGFTGTGDLVGTISGPNFFQVDRVDEDGNENPMYLVKPTIEKISFSVADNDTLADDLLSEKFHLVNKVVYGPAIQSVLQAGATMSASGDDLLFGDDDGGQVQDGEIDTWDDDFEIWDDDDLFADDDDLVTDDDLFGGDDDFTVLDGDDELLDGEDEDAPAFGIKAEPYPRIGLAFMTFTYDWPTVHEMEVRQAIAWCMDREALTQAYTSGFGLVVNGYYGIEQWEYMLCTGRLDYPVNFVGDQTHTEKDLEEWGKHANMYATTEAELEEMTAAWKTLNLDNLVEYKVDLDKAKALLISNGWVLNRDGERYDPDRDDVRCKLIDGELVALDLSLMYPEGNHIVDTMQENFIDNLNECGILLTLVPTPMEDLLRSYYREAERTTDMIYLATNFHVVVDPSITYSADTTANHLIWNNTYSDDEDLYWRAVNMRRTDPLDVYDYVAKWISFQERYNEVLPTIPIYSNIYFDFWNDMLQNYHVTAHVTWSQAILQSYFGEEEELPMDEESDGLGDGVVIID